MCRYLNWSKGEGTLLHVQNQTIHCVQRRGSHSITCCTDHAVHSLHRDTPWLPLLGATVGNPISIRDTAWLLALIHEGIYYISLCKRSLSSMEAAAINNSILTHKNTVVDITLAAREHDRDIFPAWNIKNRTSQSWNYVCEMWQEDLPNPAN